MLPNELMFMNWQNLIKPEKIQVSRTSTYGKFVCEPLEKGYGITIGNALRRVLLSSLYGAAIVSVKFESVVHEFSSIPNVYEDVSEIILNLKQVRFKVTDPKPKVVYIETDTKGKVTAGDIKTEEGCEVLNHDLHIANLTDNGVFKAEMIVETGKGYALSEMHKDEFASDNTVPIDAVFSPIKNVNYVVDNARVGQKTDYDRLTLEIWTDGSVSPEDALAYSGKILKEHMSIFINFDELVEVKVDKKDGEENKPQFNQNLYRSVEELELSVRSANCLKNAKILNIYQLVSKTETEMLKTKNFGRKSLNEIKEVLNEMDLSLGMKLDGFVPPEEDVEEGE